MMLTSCACSVEVGPRLFWYTITSNRKSIECVLCRCVVRVGCVACGVCDDQIYIIALSVFLFD